MVISPIRIDVKLLCVGMKWRLTRYFLRNQLVPLHISNVVGGT